MVEEDDNANAGLKEGSRTCAREGKRKMYKRKVGQVRFRCEEVAIKESSLLRSEKMLPNPLVLCHFQPDNQSL